MSGIFILIFGGIYLLYLYYQEQKSKNEIQEQIGMQELCYSLCAEKYEASKELEDAIKDYILDGLHNEDIKKDLQKYFKIIFGDAWECYVQLPFEGQYSDMDKRFLKYYKNVFLSEDNVYCIIYDLLLAKKEKFRSGTTRFGYFLSFIDPDSYQVKTIKCIEEIFHENGHENIEFVREEGASAHPVSGTMILSSILSITHKEGKRLW